MTDYTLCVWRSECSLSARCWRATAERADHWHQSFFAPSRRGKRCPYFIDNQKNCLDGPGSGKGPGSEEVR